MFVELDKIHNTGAAKTKAVQIIVRWIEAYRVSVFFVLEKFTLFPNELFAPLTVNSLCFLTVQ